MTQTPRILGGYEIHGEVPRWRIGKSTRHPIDELLTYLDAVMVFGPAVAAVRWNAFTPETPDPDGCHQYRVEDPEFQFINGEKFFRYAEIESAWTGTGPRLGADGTLWHLIQLFSAALVDGDYTVAMLENFGVNVQVTATPGVISIESFDPDY
ncbi:hypothetical protein OG563_26320 [Nocardia vinacea]|uniref:Uncharacterized protein n=1 Tax=Nocardia vinacea TaxID=96468 RepID=A0ABZ1YHQ9_9NOCA|nr:hypothetical protein [Nocardia vinacea]